VDPKKLLLRHIGLEEKILLPTAQRLRGGEALVLAAKLRLHHCALIALPSPASSTLEAIRNSQGP